MKKDSEIQIDFRISIREILKKSGYLNQRKKLFDREVGRKNKKNSFFHKIEFFKLKSTFTIQKGLHKLEHVRK